MKTLTHTLAIALLGSASFAQDSLSWSKSIGNGDGGAKISFDAWTRQNDDLLFRDALVGSSEVKAVARLFGERVRVLEVVAHGITHNGHQKDGMYPKTQARATLEVGGYTVLTRTGNTAASFSYDHRIPIVGPAKRFGLGPYGVRVNAGLYAKLEPQARAEASASSRRVGSEISGKVTLTAGASGRASGGSFGGIEVISELDLFAVTLGLDTDASDARTDAGIQIRGDAARIHVKLKAWLKVLGVKKSFTKTIVDETAHSWSKYLD